MEPGVKRYFVLHKPFKMVSQFISTHKVGLLGDLDFSFPVGTHAIGRLDNDSEGLLLLTTNKKVTRLLFLSDTPHKRTYLVQINNAISEQNLQRLQTGVTFKIKTGIEYTTAPCEVKIVDNPEAYCIMAERLTAYMPYTWLLITITEGKFHQVRKMIGAIRHKVKRLIRISIEDLTLDNLEPGKVREMGETEFFRQLKIDNYEVS
ncbi:pseudouridine synthase [Ferruginibacter sp. SUN106]|uniref:pseudouridine synthase n=1 Tax=Ferruginibacter sp. SUN106 TaxID=2978348 RepID=UPI003D361F8E